MSEPGVFKFSAAYLNLKVASDNRESFLRFRVGKGRIRQVPVKILCERRAQA
jgi:hypothetical protein